MSECKYFNDKDIPNNVRVWFKTLDKDGNVIRDYTNQACFSDLTYYGISSAVKKIIIYNQKKLTPYKFNAVKRWIKEINKLGFPCSCSENDETFEFTVNLDEYTWKAHLISTLMLIRALIEGGINKVPEFFLTAIDADPKIDKFQALQDAHKDSRMRYYNSNHMITYQGNGRNVDSKTLHERYKNSAIKVYETKGDYHNVGQSDKWNGG